MSWVVRSAETPRVGIRRRTGRMLGQALALELAACWLVLGGTDAMAAVADAPDNVAPPSISGTLEVGQTLSADPGTWSNGAQQYQYSWLTCDGFALGCASVDGATQATYVLRAADVGRHVELVVDARSATGAFEWFQTDATGPVLPVASTPVVAPPVNQTSPVVGDAREGAALTADPGRWDGSPTRYSYQWYACRTYVDGAGAPSFGCYGLIGATGSSLAVTSADIRLQFEVAVIASNAGGDSGAIHSPATTAVLPLPPVNQAAPSLGSGPVIQGDVITVTDWSWTSEDWASPTYEYQWLRCRPDLSGCVEVVRSIPGLAYFLTADDIGRRIVAEVVAVNAGGRSTPVASNATSVVVGLPPGSPIYIFSPHLGPNGPEFFVQVGTVPDVAGADSSTTMTAPAGPGGAICAVSHRKLVRLVRPNAHVAAALAAYTSRALRLVDRGLRRVGALRWSPAIRRALGVEARKLAIEGREVAAFRRGDLTGVGRLSRRATALARAADVLLERNGLSDCVG